MSISGRVDGGEGGQAKAVYTLQCDTCCCAVFQYLTETAVIHNKTVIGSSLAPHALLQAV